MNSLQHRLIELVRIAETPLYSAYKWLTKEVGRDLSLMGFRKMVSELTSSGVLQLWQIDPVTGERSRLQSVPANLPELYTASPDLDDAFDAFGYSLTVGERIDRELPASWTIDFHEATASFFCRARLEREHEAMSEIRELFPDVVFTVHERIARDQHVELVGSVAQAQ